MSITPHLIPPPLSATLKKTDLLTILACTGNLGNAEPSPQDLAAWIPSHGKCNGVTPLVPPNNAGPTTTTTIEHDDTFDLIVVGMQESTWSGTSNRQVTFDSERDADGGGGDDDDDDDVRTPENAAAAHANGVSPASQRDLSSLSKLARMLEVTVGKEYQCIVDNGRGQMRLVVLCRSDIVADITNVTTTGHNTGIAGLVSNKGGIVLSLVYQETTCISFVAAHLAAHEGIKHYQDRCASLQRIFEHAKTHSIYDVTLSSHHVFVLGDLNFRPRFPDHPPPPQEEGDANNHNNNSRSSVDLALELIQQGKFQELYELDELVAGMKAGDLLSSGFETLPCDFSPTFKVKRQEGFAYNPQRTPSYTDRILYRSWLLGPDGQEKYLKPFAYEPCPHFTSSDHKPIRGAFVITPNTTINKLYQQRQQEQQMTLRNSRTTTPTPTPLSRMSTIMKRGGGGRRQSKSYSSSYHLKLYNISCTNLPSLDVIGESDPYVMVTWDYISSIIAFDNHRDDEGFLRRTWNKNNHKWPCTKFISNTANPIFEGQEINLHVMNDGDGPVGVVGVEAMLFIAVMDYDLHSKDDLIATLPINLHALISQLSSSSTTTTTIAMDEPLMKNGRENWGRIKLSIDITKSVDNNNNKRIRKKKHKNNDSGGCYSSFLRCMGCGSRKQEDSY